MVEVGRRSFRLPTGTVSLFALRTSNDISTGKNDPVEYKKKVELTEDTKFPSSRTAHMICQVSVRVYHEPCMGEVLELREFREIRVSSRIGCSARCTISLEGGGPSTAACA